MRTSPATGKEDCHIIDFVDARNRFNGLFSTPHLLGLNPNVIQGAYYIYQLVVAS